MTVPEDEARELSRLVVRHADTQVFLSDDVVRVAAAGKSEERPFGLRGKRWSRGAPFATGFTAALGVAVAAVLVEATSRAWGVLILMLLAAFIAIGLDAAAAWLVAFGWRRGWAVFAVLIAAAVVLTVFVMTAVPAVSNEYRHLSSQVPRLLAHLQHRHDGIGRAARRVHLNSATVARVVAFNGVASLAATLLSLLVAAITTVVLTAYFLANLPKIKATAIRLVPRHRRARVGLLTDEILRLIGAYLLGNIVTSAIAGVAMTVFLLVLGVPDAFFLGLLVALFDLIPMVGAPVAGVVVAVVALSVSVPTAIAVVAFTVIFRLLEDYLLSPRVMRATVEIAPLLTIVGVLIGGALLGILGALIAVPTVAALDLIRKEVFQPRVDAD